MKKILAILFAVSLFYFVGAKSVLASTTFNVEVKTYLDETNMNQAAPGLTEQVRGSKVQFTPTGISEAYSFAFYAVNDIVRDDLPQNYEFVVRSNMKITAFYRPNGSVTPANARHVVIFADNNGKIINNGVQYVAHGGTATEPSVLPDKPNAVYATPKWFTPQGESSLANVTSSRVYLLQYISNDNTEYTVNVTGGSVVEAGPYNYNEVVTLQPSAAPAEQVFSHWEDSEGNVLSTKANYKFTVMGNVSVAAVFAATPEFTGAVVNMSDALSIRSGYVTYKGQFDLPTGFTLVEYGFIFSRSSEVLTLTSLGATIVPSNVHNGQTGEFLRSFPNDTFNSVRAYLIVKNVAQEEVIVYSENSYLNDNLSAPQVLKSVDFESSSGFSALTTYNNTTLRYQGNVGEQWAFYFGTSSTTGPISGLQSAQLRWYSTSPTNFGYLVMDYTVSNVDYISFKASGTDGNDLNVEYSLNDSPFTGLELFDLTSTASLYNYQINQTGNLKIRFTLVSGGVNASRVTIDDVSFYRSVNASSSNRVHEIKYNDDSISYEYVLDGNKVIKPQPSKVGYTFNGWFTDVELTQQYDLNTTVNQSLDLYAKWTINQTTITFNSNGGSAVSSITQNYNTAVSEPSAPTRTGYTFAGWHSDVALTASYTFSTMPAQNFTLYAKWTLNNYTINFDSNGGTEVTSITQGFGTSVSAPTEPTLEGYTFSGWYYDDITFANIVTFPVSMPEGGDVFYAKWVEASSTSFTVSFVIDITTTYTQPNQTVSSGGVATEPTSVSAKYIWYSNEARTILYNFATSITENVTVYGKIFMKDLIISEYVEGSSSNKYIEIFNGTGESVDLSNYRLALYPNGGSTPNPSPVTLSGTLAHGQVIVLRNTAATLTLPNGVSSTVNTSVNYNGDDALALQKNISGVWTNIDIFGQIGFDPGTAWSSNNVSTVDKTLVRKTDILVGDSIGDNVFDPSIQWTQFNMDTVSNLGSHTANISNPS